MTEDDYVVDLVKLHAERILAAAGVCLDDCVAPRERRLILSTVLDCYEAGYRAGSEGVMSRARGKLEE